MKALFTASTFAGQPVDYFMLESGEYALSHSHVCRLVGVDRTTLTHYEKAKDLRANPISGKQFSAVVSVNMATHEQAVFVMGTKAVAGFLCSLLQSPKTKEDTKAKVQVLLVELTNESIEERARHAFGVLQPTVEQKEEALASTVEKTAYDFKAQHEQVIQEMGYMFQRSAGHAGLKREFLSWVLEGVGTAELVAKQLVDSKGHVLAEAGKGQNKSYTKLDLTDPEYQDMLRLMYQRLVAGMCKFKPGVGDYRTGWVKTAVKVINSSPLTAEEKAVMVARANGFFS